MTAEDSLDHNLDLVAGIGVVVGTKPVEDAKAVDRAVGDRHAARQALDRVTAWPAAMSRGTMPAPMAPRPTKPMFMRSPRNVAKRDDAAEAQQRLPA